MTTVATLHPCTKEQSRIPPLSIRGMNPKQVHWGGSLKVCVHTNTASPGWLGQQVLDSPVSSGPRPHCAYTTPQPLALPMHYGEASNPRGRLMVIAGCPMTKLSSGDICLSWAYNWFELFILRPEGAGGFARACLNASEIETIIASGIVLSFNLKATPTKLN